MAFDNHANFAVSTVVTAPSPASSGTTLTVARNTGVLFPAPPFNAVVSPAGLIPTLANSEIIRITGVSGDNFVISRQTEGSNSRTIQAGDTIVAAITVKVITDLETAITNILNNYVVSVPMNANYRFKDGLIQIWDAGYAAANAATPWATIALNNGVISVSGPIAN